MNETATKTRKNQTPTHEIQQCVHEYQIKRASINGHESYQRRANHAQMVDEMRPHNNSSRQERANFKEKIQNFFGTSRGAHREITFKHNKS